MYETEWGEILASWCSEDLKLKKKNRRTKKQLYTELKAVGFPGSYRTICYFITEWENSKHIDEVKDKGFDRLEHPMAEAQVDFGTMEVVHEGSFMNVHVLVMSFPYSNASFATPLPGENLECFLEGLKLLFKQAGGVPKKLRIDNLTPAVKKVRSKFERAQLTDGFQQFENFFGFETQVCNPRSGNEKGNVENKVGYIRYNFFSTSPIMESFELLNKQLQTQLNQDRQRFHHEKKVLIEELWSAEANELLALPIEDYPVFKEVKIKSNKYNEVVIDKTQIHVPKAQNFSILYAILKWDSFKIVTTNGEILLSDYRPYMNKKRMIEWMGILKDWLYKLNVMTYSRYWKYLPGRIREYLNVSDLKIRQERIHTLISLLATYDLKSINERFYELLSTDTVDAFSVDWNKYDLLTKSPSEVLTDVK